MSGSTTRGRLHFLMGMLLALLVGYATLTYLKPSVRWHTTNAVGCIDVQGRLAISDKGARYYRDGATLVGENANGDTLFYTPPAGWVCKIEETADK